MRVFRGLRNVRAEYPSSSSASSSFLLAQISGVGTPSCGEDEQSASLKSDQTMMDFISGASRACQLLCYYVKRSTRSIRRVRSSLPRWSTLTLLDSFIHTFSQADLAETCSSLSSPEFPGPALMITAADISKRMSRLVVHCRTSIF